MTVEVTYDDEREVYIAGGMEFTEDEIVSYDSQDQPQIEDDAGKEYSPAAGNLAPIEETNIGAEPCNTTLDKWEERYGERRYCGKPALKGEPYCKTHINNKTLDKLHMESFETGAYLKSYEDLMEYLPVHKKVLAIDIYNSLIEDSRYNFDITREKTELESPIGVDEDITMEIDMPIPTEKRARCQSLWYAALELVKIQNINEQLFKDAAESGDTVTEREQVVASGEDGPVYDMDEHHLNLPLSRIQSKYKDHLKFGGVELDGDEIAVNVGGSSRREFKEIEPPDDG